MRTARDEPVAVTIVTKLYVMGGTPASGGAPNDRLKSAVRYTP